MCYAYYCLALNGLAQNSSAILVRGMSRRCLYSADNISKEQITSGKKIYARCWFKYISFIRKRFWHGTKRDTALSSACCCLALSGLAQKIVLSLYLGWADDIYTQQTTFLRNRLQVGRRYACCCLALNGSAQYSSAHNSHILEGVWDVQIAFIH